MSSSPGHESKFILAAEANHNTSRGSKKRIFIIAISVVVLLAIIIGVAVGVRKVRSDNTGDQSSTAAANINAVCTYANNPDSCSATLSALSEGKPVSVPELYRLSVHLAMSELSNATLLFSKLESSGRLDAFLASAAENCKELLSMAIGALNDTLNAGGQVTATSIDDFRTWLSAGLTYQDTCLIGFENATAALRTEVAGYLGNSTGSSGNSLAIIAFISQTLGTVKLHRKLLGSDEFPSWMSAADRRLLQANVDPRTMANIVVAQDGTGKFSTIGDAIAAVPKGGSRRNIIYVKEGVYKEKVIIPKGVNNVMIVGDGMDATVITGSLNFVDGTQTYDTATLAVLGSGFLGRNFAVENTAGAAKHQAVALMSNSDQSAYYLMRLDGFQDTLYNLANRQFFRQCDIYGTVDFIFGNAAVVFQNCNILPRVPLPGQSITITAQGKIDQNQNTGTSIQSCTVTAYGNLAGFNVYLGRPWKYYSTTIFMNTFLPAIINPKGWLPWVGTSAPSTIFYAEYLNTGPGSGTAGRVTWSGVNSALSPQKAAGFTVNSFINGGQWLPATGVPFSPGL